MTWQDELQNLDAELAAGRISAEEYRSRRDALIGRSQGEQDASSSGGFPQQPADPQPGTPSGGSPQQGGQQQSPFPPAFNWGEAVAQGAQQQNAQQQNQPQPSEESTQVVRNPLTGSQPGGGQPWPDQQQWNQGWTPANSPWGEQDPAAAPEHGDTSWMRQGPEVFEVSEGSGKGKLIAGLSIGAVLIIGVVVAGIFYATSSGDEPPPQPQTTQPAPPPPAPSNPLPEPPAQKAPPAATPDVLVPAPAGPPHPLNGLLDRPALETGKRGVLQDPVRNAALQGGMVDGWINRTDGPPSAVLLTVRMPDDAAASAVAQAYLKDQKGLNVDEDLSYQGVQVVTTGGGVFRTAYVAHGWVIVVEVSDANKQAAENTFVQLLTQQLAKTPPTVRG